MRKLLVTLCCYLCLGASAQVSREKLLGLLGKMPAPPALQVDTLEKSKLDKGWRYKIRWLAEDSSVFFHSPKDFIYAYLFVPDHDGKRLPAIVAIHQDGAHDGLGKSEPAGLAGDADQHYGLELFERGYIVICPDRFYHAQRRRIKDADSSADAGDAGEKALSNWIGELLLAGRTASGKEVYDLMRCVDVLCHTPGVDTARIGAIGHSAGGYALGYFMFADKRIKAGASSCGVFELAEWYDEKGPRRNNAEMAIPGLLPARTADFIGSIAPRPFLMTRGMNEWGWGDSTEKAQSLYHVNSTRRLEDNARKYYQTKHVSERLQVIYFTENGGLHSFPPGVKTQVYEWLDRYLKK
jgi:dienelactone hydrolase